MHHCSIVREPLFVEDKVACARCIISDIAASLIIPDFMLIETSNARNQTLADPIHPGYMERNAK
mgnify:CR=1 FL=1